MDCVPAESAVEGCTAASEGYAAEGREFFGQVGRWLVEVARVPRGAWVLDVGCGEGAVSIPAAVAAGPDGHVTGIDLAAPMLTRARARARSVGAGNVTFRLGDARAPGTCPGWPPGSFDVILAGDDLQFLPRPAKAAARWRELLAPGGRVGLAWMAAQDSRWGPVIAAVDAHVPDGAPTFGAFMRRPPFGDVAQFEAMLAGAGYVGVATVTRPVTIVYNGPAQWWATAQSQGAWALSWRHIPAGGLVQAKWDACALLEPLRADDGVITRILTFAFTTAGSRPGLHVLPAPDSTSGDN
jgi:SAM-dependent methyltransferase